MEPVQRERRSPSSYISNVKVKYWEQVPIPKSRLTAKFGGYDVTSGYEQWFRRYFEPRIVFWQAELMARVIPDDADSGDSRGISRSEMAAAPATHSVRDQLRALLTEANVQPEEIENEIGFTARSIYRHIADDSEVKIVRRKNIAAYERVFSKLLNRQVVIHQTSVKRQKRRKKS
jgi:hypothetical protein